MAVLRKVYGGFMVPAKVARHERGSNGGRVRVRIIHGLNTSHKELIYLLRELLFIEMKYYTHAPSGIDW